MNLIVIAFVAAFFTGVLAGVLLTILALAVGNKLQN